MHHLVWRLATQTLQIGDRPLVMGIVNVTPDSFSDGGLYGTTENAVAHALELVEQGADILDIGGESTRPRAPRVPLKEELLRVVPVVKSLVRQTQIAISVDTSKAEVARQCLQHGAQIINDVTALAGDAKMLSIVRQFKAGVVLMHMQGDPATMQDNPRYQDVVGDLVKFFRRRMGICKKHGIHRDQIAIDPGIGFGKTLEHTLTLLARLEDFQKLKRPVLLGVSRKGFIGQLTGRSRSERLVGSVAAASYAMGRGAVQIIRAHDVRDTRDAATLCGRIQEFGKPGKGRSRKSQMRVSEPKRH